MPENAETWEVRKSIFEFLRECGASYLRSSVRPSDKNHPYIQVLRSTDAVEIALYVSDLQCEILTYVVSLDSTGELDSRILAGINRHPPTGATFVDCSNEPRHGYSTRNVCKLVRSVDWENITEANRCAILDDYNWLVGELCRIGVL